MLGWPETLAKPEELEVLQVGARNIFTEKHIADWVFRDLLSTSVENQTFVPSPEVELVDGGLYGLQTGLNTLKKGVSGKKIVVTLG